MLTGLTAPSSGSATVYGRDIASDLDSIRLDMGVCPQHDVLYPDLTVEEHIRLYARLKGVPTAELASVIQQAVLTVGLTEKVKVCSAQLCNICRC